MRVAILSATRAGAELGRTLQAALGPGTALYGPAGSGLPLYPGPLSQAVGELFQEYDGLVLFLAAGAAIRLLAPHLKSKRTDPGVVVVDAAGHYAVSLLAGHLGGGNELARRVAAALGATPVLTTASEALGLPALDLWMDSQGLKVDDPTELTRAMAAAVNGEELRFFGPVAPPGYRPHVLAEYRPGNGHYSLVITERTDWAPDPRALFLRPPNLRAGLGCRRGTAAREIRAALAETLAAAGLSPLSLTALASIDLKMGEPGLIAAARELGLPLRLFAPSRLAAVPGLSESEYVRAKVGVGAVCEPAALLAGGETTLVVSKRRFPGVTVAIAAAAWPWSGSVPAARRS